MSKIFIREFEETFVLYFGGEFRRINAYTLASSLVSIADAAKAANTVINTGYEVEVVVEALGDGSFKAKVRAFYHKLDNLFSVQDAKAIVFAVIAAYIAQQTFPPEVEVKIITNPENVVIEAGDKTIIIPREVHNALQKVEKSQSFRSSISKTFQSVEKDKRIESIGIARDMSDDPPPISIPRKRFAWLSQEVNLDEDDIREITEHADLQILRAILQRSKRRWQFVWRGITISAPITDSKFYDDFTAHRITIAPGDILEAILKITQEKDLETGIYINSKYEVVQVLKHRLRMQQSELKI